MSPVRQTYPIDPTLLFDDFSSNLCRRGLSEVELAAYRGLGAVLGVSATYLFPPMHAKLGAHMSPITESSPHFPPFPATP